MDTGKDLFTNTSKSISKKIVFSFTYSRNIII